MSRGWELGTAIINLEMISLLPSVIDGDFLGLPILVLLCFFPIIPQIPGDLQKKVNRLIIAAHDNRISDSADELLYMKDGRIEKI